MGVHTPGKGVREGNAASIKGCQEPRTYVNTAALPAILFLSPLARFTRPTDSLGRRFGEVLYVVSL